MALTGNAAPHCVRTSLCPWGEEKPDGACEERRQNPGQHSASRPAGDPFSPDLAVGTSQHSEQTGGVGGLGLLRAALHTLVPLSRGTHDGSCVGGGQNRKGTQGTGPSGREGQRRVGRGTYIEAGDL